MKKDSDRDSWSLESRVTWALAVAAMVASHFVPSAEAAPLPGNVVGQYCAAGETANRPEWKP